MTGDLINEEDILSRVQRYELNRGREYCLFIDVHKVILPDNLKNTFVAEPNLRINSAQGEYLGYGETEKEALDDCLRKIKNVSNDILFPKFGTLSQ